MDSYTAPLTLTVSDLANVFNYLQNNMTTTGSTVAFNVSGSSYLFQEDGSNDTLIQLADVTTTGISTTGLAVGAVWIV